MAWFGLNMSSPHNHHCLKRCNKLKCFLYLYLMFPVYLSKLNKFKIVQIYCLTQQPQPPTHLYHQQEPLHQLQQVQKQLYPLPATITTTIITYQCLLPVPSLPKLLRHNSFIRQQLLPQHRPIKKAVTPVSQVNRLQAKAVTE